MRGIGAAGGAALAAGFSRPSSTARAEPLDRSAARAKPLDRSAARAKPFDRLREAGIGVTARVTRFDGPAVTSGDVALGAAAVARGAVAGGTLTISAATAAGRADAIDLVASFRPRGRAASAALGVRLGLGAWTREDYLVLPGAAYAGNRFESRHLAYPPLLTEPADIGPNVPIIVSDIPRLNLRDGPSALERAAGDSAVPAAALYAPAARRGLILLFDPATPLGPTGIGVAEADDCKSATIAVTAPFAAEDRPGARSAGRSPGRRRGTLVRDGEQVSLRARLYLFDCPDVAALYAKLFAVRKDLTGPTARVHELPFSAAFAVHEERVNRRWLETPGVFAVGARDIVDTAVQHGTDDDPDGLPSMVQKTNADLGGAPADGIDETSWLRDFLAIRRATLENPSSSHTSDTWRESVGRVDALHALLDAGNPAASEEGPGPKPARGHQRRAGRIPVLPQHRRDRPGEPHRKPSEVVDGRVGPIRDERPDKVGHPHERAAVPCGAPSQVPHGARARGGACRAGARRRRREPPRGGPPPTCSARLAHARPPVAHRRGRPLTVRTTARFRPGPGSSPR